MRSNVCWVNSMISQNPNGIFWIIDTYYNICMISDIIFIFIKCKSRCTSVNNTMTQRNIKKIIDINEFVWVEKMNVFKLILFLIIIKIMFIIRMLKFIFLLSYSVIIVTPLFENCLKLIQKLIQNLYKHDM